MLYIFNPDHDLALADFKPNYTPPASILKMKADLALLPIWYGGECKVVADGEDNNVFFDTIKEILPIESELVSFADIKNYGDEKIVPWGWNPSMRKKLVVDGVSEERVPTISELEQLRVYSNRINAVEVLKELKYENRELCGESHYFTHLDDVLHYLKSIPGDKVLKMPMSGSGRGLVWILGEITDKQTDWCRRVIHKQGGVVAEPVMDKVVDFALEFYFSSGRAEFIGYSLFKTTTSGAYSGNWLLSDSVIEDRLSSYISIEEVHKVRELLLSKLTKRFANFHGPMGVDMMICRVNDGLGYKIHPCVEINMRMNMGVVSNNIYSKFIGPGSEGHYMVEYFKGKGEALAFHEKMQREKPLKIDNGRIVSGYLALTPVASATHYVAFVLCTTHSGHF